MKMTPALKHWLTALSITLAFGTVFLLMQWVLYTLGYVRFFPNEQNLKQWDAGIYYDVATHGYYSDAEFHDNTGVFILFPWLWKALHTGYVGISVANYVLFAIGMAFLCTHIQLSWRKQLLWLSVPSLYFMMVPYTEATFFLLASLFLVGWARNNYVLVFATLFLLCLCRATASFLMPGLLLAELLSAPRRQVGQGLARFGLWHALPITLGTGTFILLQYATTGKWMPYYYRQVHYLGHKFSWPTLPFCDFYGGDKILWLNALSLCIGALALLYLIGAGIGWLRRGTAGGHQYWLLSAAYMVSVSATMVFFNPTWGDDTTNLLGLHRYLFCSPFFFIGYHWFTNQRTVKVWQLLLLVFVVCNVVLLSLHSYEHIRKLLYFNAGTGLLLLYLAAHQKRLAFLQPVAIVVGFVVQVWLYQLYLSGAFTE